MRTFTEYMKYLYYGDSINMVAASVCQLKCPVCTMKWRIREELGDGYLKFQDFKGFVDTYPNFKKIEIAGKGEMFLNPDLEAILEYSFARGIQLTARTGTNLNRVRERVLEALVKYRLRFLTVSIDGASQDTYKIYRVGGSFGEVINNIRILNSHKDKYNSHYPKLSWQFIVFGHNEHELPFARRMAEDLGMAFTPIFNEDDEYSPIIDRSFVQREMGIASDSEFNDKFNELRVKGPLFACKQLWGPLQINWDGRLVSCMCNSVPYPVNVFQSGLRAAVTEEKFAYTRNMLSGKVAARDDIPCVPCQAYQYRRAHGQYAQAENERARALRTLIRELLPQGFGTLMRKAFGARGIERTYAVEQARQRPRDSSAGGQADRDAKRHRAHRLPADELYHIAPLRTHGHADADFPGPLDDRIGHHAVDPNNASNRPASPSASARMDRIPPASE